MRYSFVRSTSEDNNGSRLAKFWEDQQGIKLFSPYSIIGIIDTYKDTVVGVVLFTEYTGSNIDLHFTGNSCVNKTTIRYVMQYVFNELQCNVLRIKAHSNNEKIIDYIQRVGFEYECTLDKYYSLKDHAIVYKMDRDKVTRWIELDVAT